MRAPELVTAHAELDVMLFELQRECFALPLTDVLEVLRAVAIRRLPNAPAVVEGIIDVRGELVPVLDVRARFGLSPKPLELSDHFVVAAAAQRKVALRVDRALGMSRLLALPLPRAVNLPRGVSQVSGIASAPDGLVLLHDLEEFLSEAESTTLAGALRESSEQRSGGGG
jgi:purine-binding chemotaxis protein CheW